MNKSYIYFGPLVKCSEEYNGDECLYELVEEKLREVNGGEYGEYDVWIPNIKGYGFTDKDLETGYVAFLRDLLQSGGNFRYDLMEEIQLLKEYYSSVEVGVGFVKYWM